MDDLHISYEDLYDLPVAFPNISNTESVLYEYYPYILKIFNTLNTYDLLRLQARLMFWKNNNFDYLINPEFMVFVDKYFQGFGMNKYNGDNIHSYISKVSLDDKINIFHVLSTTLERAHKDGVIIGDLSHNNILTNGNEVKFCDVNSMGFINKINPLMLPYFLDKNMNIKEDDKGTILSDVFLINTMVFEYLIKDGVFPYNLSLNDYIIYIDKLHLPEEISDVFLNLYNIFEGSQLIYPHRYLQVLSDYKRTRKKF